VCVRERERERERESGCVCVCERERERVREMFIGNEEVTELEPTLIWNKAWHRPDHFLVVPAHKVGRMPSFIPSAYFVGWN
jgi:hypothetical protein